MQTNKAALLDEAQCQELDSFLADRIYEFNVEATSYDDGKLMGASIRGDTGEVIAGFSGHTWGGCCEISHLWVHIRHRGQGFGKMLLEAAEAEAQRRGCTQVVLMTHSFQAPVFYEHFGFKRVCTIEGWPDGHSKITYVKLLQYENDKHSPALK